MANWTCQACLYSSTSYMGTSQAGLSYLSRCWHPHYVAKLTPAMRTTLLHTAKRAYMRSNQYTPHYTGVVAASSVYATCQGVPLQHRRATHDHTSLQLPIRRRTQHLVPTGACF
jgi:hypothetical protein